LQEKLPQALSEPDAKLTTAEQRDQVMNLAEAHCELLSSKVKYDQSLRGLLSNLSPSPLKVSVLVC